MGGNDEVAVFTDTSLGTSLAMAVPPDITAADFERELGLAHISCFPLMGEIKIEGIMVKRKSHFYTLPDSMPMKHVFRGHQGAWFVHAKAATLNGSDRSGVPDCHDKAVMKKIYSSRDVANTLVRNREQEGMLDGDRNGVLCVDVKKCVPLLPKLQHIAKERKQSIGYGNDDAEKCSLTETEGIPNVVAQDSCFLKLKNEVEPPAEDNSNLPAKTPIKRSSLEDITAAVNWSEARSCVSCAEVQSTSGSILIQAQQVEPLTKDHSSTAQIGAIPQFMVQTPPQDSSYRSAAAERYATSGNKSSKSNVGKRLVMAANNIRTPTNKYRSAVLFDRFRERKLSKLNIPSLARFLVFEVSKSDGE